MIDRFDPMRYFAMSTPELADEMRVYKDCLPAKLGHAVEERLRSIVAAECAPAQPVAIEPIAYEWKELAPRGGNIHKRVGYPKDVPPYVPTSELRALVYAPDPHEGARDGHEDFEDDMK